MCTGQKPHTEREKKSIEFKAYPGEAALDHGSASRKQQQQSIDSFPSRAVSHRNKCGAIGTAEGNR